MRKSIINLDTKSKLKLFLFAKKQSLYMFNLTKVIIIASLVLFVFNSVLFFKSQLSLNKAIVFDIIILVLVSGIALFNKFKQKEYTYIMNTCLEDHTLVEFLKTKSEL